MALSLPVPSVSNSSQEITLDGITYTFLYRFNERDQRWRISIFLEDVEVISNVKVMENRFLLTRYRLPKFSHGDIVCLRSLDDGKDVGRNNFGTGLAYELIYYTYDEINNL